ncbi:hypothetical protein EYF80_017908 [Liparis tanakae]|uniref:Uncharacterized protein n=1 Tax=Liparis tanakae TaxID=230148 RepID=A0A4Z2I297_9TELE|nr:hypothetical protein EYF80_017908 [Liparis tanakae]
MLRRSRARAHCSPCFLFSGVLPRAEGEDGVFVLCTQFGQRVDSVRGYVDVLGAAAEGSGTTNSSDFSALPRMTTACVCHLSTKSQRPRKPERRRADRPMSLKLLRGGDLSPISHIQEIDHRPWAMRDKLSFGVR